MKKLFLIFVLLISSVAYSQVVEQQTRNKAGQLYIRFVNQTNIYAACYYKDNVNYFTFTLAPGGVTPWHRIYGSYVWECSRY